MKKMKNIYHAKFEIDIKQYMLIFLYGMLSGVCFMFIYMIAGLL